MPAYKVTSVRHVAANEEAPPSYDGMNDYISNSQKGMESNTEDTPEPEFWVPPLFNVTPLAFEPLILTQLVTVTGPSFLLDSCHTGCCPARAGANLFASSAVGKTA